MREVTIQEAISQEGGGVSETIFPSKKLEYNGGEANYALKDIFGNHHFFFRPYSIQTQAFETFCIYNAYCFSNQEVVLTKSKDIVTSYTSSKQHPLGYLNKKTFKTTLWNIIIFLKRCKILFRCLFARQIKGKVALLRINVEDYYGHTISDIVMNYIQVMEFAKRHNQTFDYYIFPTKTKFHRELAEILGIPQNKIISTSQNKAFRVNALIVPTLLNDYEMVDYRGYLHYRGKYPIDFLSIFWNQKIEGLIQNQTKTSRKIFLKRPKKGNRQIINSIEVEKIFEQYGFEIILPDNLSLKAQIELFRQAKCIASLHGSGLDNVLFAKDNIFVFEIFSEYYHDSNPLNKVLSKHCRYFYMIGKTLDTSMHPQQEDVWVDPKKLDLALNILDSKLSQINI